MCFTCDKKRIFTSDLFFECIRSFFAVSKVQLLLSTLIGTDEANRFERLIIVEFELYVHSRPQ